VSLIFSVKYWNCVPGIISLSLNSFKFEIVELKCVIMSSISIYLFWNAYDNLNKGYKIS